MFKSSLVQSIVNENETSSRVLVGEVNFVPVAVRVKPLSPFVCFVTSLLLPFSPQYPAADSNVYADAKRQEAESIAAVSNFFFMVFVVFVLS